MNRSELVAALADRAEVTRKDADAVLAALAETVGEIVAKGDEKVTIPGFLTFERTHRAARTARNPQTGDPINIPAGYSVKVSAARSSRKPPRASNNPLVRRRAVTPTRVAALRRTGRREPFAGLCAGTEALPGGSPPPGTRLRRVNRPAAPPSRRASPACP